MPADEYVLGWKGRLRTTESTSTQNESRNHVAAAGRSKHAFTHDDIDDMRREDEEIALASEGTAM